MKTADITVGAKYAVSYKVWTGQGWYPSGYEATALAVRQERAYHPGGSYARKPRVAHDGVLVKYTSNGREEIVHPGQVLEPWEEYAARAEATAAREQERKEALRQDRQRVYDAHQRLAELGVMDAPTRTRELQYDTKLELTPGQLDRLLALLDNS